MEAAFTKLEPLILMVTWWVHMVRTARRLTKVAFVPPLFIIIMFLRLSMQSRK